LSFWDSVGVTKECNWSLIWLE